MLRAIARQAGVEPLRPFREFALRAPAVVDARRNTDGRHAGAKARKPAAAVLRDRRYFVAIQKPEGAGGGPRATAVVVKEVGGRIVDVRRYEQR